MLRNSKKILFYLAVACLLTPLAVSFTVYFPFIIGKATAFRLLTEIMLLVWLAMILKGGIPGIKSRLTPLIKAVLIYGLIIFLSAVFGVDFYFSFFSSNERMEGVFGIWHFILFFFILATVFNRQEIEKILKIQVLFGVFYSLLAVLGYFRIGPASALIAGGRLAGFTGNPSFFAAYMIFNAFLALYFYFRSFASLRSTSGRRSNLNNNKITSSFATRHASLAALAPRNDSLGWLVIFIIQSFLLFATLTRGAMMGYLISIIFIALGIIFLKSDFQKKSDFPSSLKKISLVFIISILALSVFTFVGKNTEFVKNNPILSRFSSISLKDPTAVSRIMSAGTAFKSFLEKPILGWGIENYEAPYVKNFNPELLKHLPTDFYFDRAHNKPMEVLATTGILGFISYFSIFAIAFWLLFQERKKTEFFLPSLALSAALLGYFIQNIFLFDFHESYLMFFLVLSFISSLYSRERSFGLRPQDDKKGGVILSVNEGSPPALLRNAKRAGLVNTRIILKQVERFFANAQNDGRTNRFFPFGKLGARMTGGVQNDNSKDSSGEMAKMLLMITVGCLVFYSSIKAVISPFLVSRDIYQLSFHIYNRNPEKAFFYLKKTLNNPSFLKEEVLLSSQKSYADYVPELAAGEETSQLLLKGNEEVLKRKPSAYRILMAKAELELLISDKQEEKLEKAAETIKRLESLAPHFPQTRMVIAKLHFLKEDYQKSIEEAERVIELNPSFASAYYLLGLIYNNSGDFEKRDENFAKAARNNFALGKNEFIMAAIDYLLKEKDYPAIVGLYHQAINLNPDNSVLYARLAVVYAKMKNKQMAVEYAKKATSLDPGLKEESEAFIKMVEAGQWEKITD